jgi:hypothetical protein
LPKEKEHLSIISSENGQYQLETPALRPGVNVFFYSVAMIWPDGEEKVGFNWFYIEGPVVD